MKLDDVIGKVAEETGIARPQLRKAVKALFAEIKNATDAGDKVHVPGWGVFTLHEREASERIGKDGVVRKLPAARRLMMKPLPIKKNEAAGKAEGKGKAAGAKGKGDIRKKRAEARKKRKAAKAA